MAPPKVLLGTVALEPNRWGTRHEDRRATIRLTDWLEGIRTAGFDGIEIWEHHLTQAEQADADRLIASDPGVEIFNSYASFDDIDDTDRAATADWTRRSGARAVKFNVGSDPAAEPRYVERIGRWLERLPDDVVALCECHSGTIAEDPITAARLLAASGPPDRVQAIVHTHESGDARSAKFDALGERITHVHVNYLDGSRGGAPPLADIRTRLEIDVTRLDELGFAGSWTIEFVHGLLTDHDRPDHLLAQAADDLRVLRDVLA